MLALLLLCSLFFARAEFLQADEAVLNDKRSVLSSDLFKSFMDQLDKSESSSKPFTTTFECLQEYWLGDEIECQYTVTNNHNNDYHVLKRFTPLEGMQSSFVSISRNGEVIPYDGIMIKRSFPPKDEEYLLLKAGSKHVLTIDLSLAYAIYETGQYTVTANIPLYYHRALHGATFEDAKQEFEPTVLTFQVHEGKSPRLTLGDFHRQRAAHPIGVQQAPNA